MDQETSKRLRAPRARAWWASVGTAGLAVLVSWIFPRAELEILARGAARLAAGFSGVTMDRVAEGWLLPMWDRPVVVSTACSGGGFFLMVAVLFAWHLASRSGKNLGVSILGGLAFAAPVAIGVNALRIIVVVQAHRWLMPRFPDSYGPMLHMLTGAAVFLPLLIVLNLILDLHGNRLDASRP
ncbi:MAG: hypothetical protein JWM32_2818 [Verrucomicrobia bacterium]|nr:hypothetical protein [Verrucomicrobiota bacterium]